MVFLFLAVLAVLILAHEAGHFFAARKNGIKVEEFGIGFPPRILKFKKGETIYSLNLFPFGGFVKIYGEDGSFSANPRSFASKSVLRRASVIIAGVLANFLLGWLIISFAFMAGSPNPADYHIPGARVKENLGVVLVEVQKGSPAEKAGLKEGDILISLYLPGREGEAPAKTIKGVKNFIDEHRGEVIGIRYKRGSSILTTLAVPEVNPGPGRGALGIAMSRIEIISLPFHLALWEGLKTSAFLAKEITLSIFHIIISAFKGESVLNSILGPVGIVGLTGSAAKLGFNYLLNFIALLSINLAIINILPFPALDGGRLLFLAIEKAKGSPVSTKTAAIVNFIGFAFLILLMAVITYRDILRLVGN